MGAGWQPDSGGTSQRAHHISRIVATGDDMKDRMLPRPCRRHGCRRPVAHLLGRLGSLKPPPVAALSCIAYALGWEGFDLDLLVVRTGVHREQCCPMRREPETPSLCHRHTRCCKYQKVRVPFAGPRLTTRAGAARTQQILLYATLHSERHDADY